MCIGLPLRLVERHGTHGLAEGRGRSEQVDLRLVGAVEPGDWLLVFAGAARERLDAARAAEIDAVLDLLEAAMADAAPSPPADPGFVLPSATSAAELALLAGASRSQRST